MVSRLGWLRAKIGLPKLLWFACLVGLNVTVFGPALNRFFAGDHLFYLAETEGAHDLAGGLQHCDYNLTRRYYKGDEVLYRPLLMAWLAVKKSLFHYHCVYWNATNLCIHLGVCLILYRLLTTIQPSFFAGVFTLLFSVLHAHVEMVLWNHIDGYMIAGGLFLLALTALLQAWRAEQPSTGKLAAFALFALPATFFYEVMAPLSLLAAVWFLQTRPHRETRLAGKHAALLFAPLVGFTAVQVLRLAWNLDAMMAGLAHPSSSTNIRLNGEALEDIVKTFWAWIVSAPLPWNYRYDTELLMRFWKTKSEPWPVVEDVVPLLVALVCYGAWRVFSWPQRRQRLTVAALFLTAMAGYTIIVVLGRQAEYLQTLCSYTMYFIGLFGALFLYALIDFAALRKAEQLPLLALLLGLLVWNSYHDWEFCWSLHRKEAAITDYFAALDAFVDEHRHEEGFSFSVPRGLPYSPDVHLVEGYPDRPRRDEWLPLAGAFYPSYYAAKGARYRFLYQPPEP